MKILVTGGSGFIGQHVVSRLLESGYSVRVFERHISSQNMRPDVEYFFGDVTNRESVFTAVFGCDGVINLAGILGTSETVQNPFPSVTTNIYGALNVFDACLQDNKVIPCVQVTVGNHFMNNSYAITKSTSERFALMYNKEKGAKIAVVRGLNVYGDHQKHYPVRKIIPNFIVRALNNDPIEIFGSGEQIMDMIYVDDFSKTLVNALLVDHGIYDKIFEAGTSRRTTVNFIAEKVIEIAGSKSVIKHIPLRQGETVDSVVVGDPETLKPLNINKEDLVVLEDGLKKTIEWYRENYDWKNYNNHR